jgi:hypothetical protein
MTNIGIGTKRARGGTTTRITRIYHNWDDRENHWYQQWTTENHRDNRDFSHLKRKGQSEYWNWRHDHPDDDRDRP